MLSNQDVKKRARAAVMVGYDAFEKSKGKCKSRGTGTRDCKWCRLDRAIDDNDYPAMRKFLKSVK